MDDAPRFSTLDEVAREVDRVWNEVVRLLGAVEQSPSKRIEDDIGVLYATLKRVDGDAEKMKARVEALEARLEALGEAAPSKGPGVAPLKHGNFEW